jgi:hypothetical protein
LPALIFYGTNFVTKIDWYFLLLLPLCPRWSLKSVGKAMGKKEKTFSKTDGQLLNIFCQNS